MADANVQLLQVQINRFYGVAIGSPISVDGVSGPQTAAALKSVLDYMQTAGGISDIDIAAQEAALSNDGGNTLDAGLVSSNASTVADVLQNFADANGLTTGTTPAASSSGGGGHGFVTSTFPKTSAATADLFSQVKALPTWVKVSGGIVLAVIVFSIGSSWAKARHRKPLRGFEGPFGLADVLKAAKSGSKVSAKKRRNRHLVDDNVIDVDFTEA